MYYRRKLLLALVEILGGNLEITDCQTLLFEFCQMTGTNHYDFFPYHHGPFSFILDYDRHRLIDLGYLQSADGFQLSSTEQTYLADLNPADRVALARLKFIGLRGESLVKRTLQANPRYASRSDRIAAYLDEDEINRIRTSWNADQSPAVFTVGYEGLSVDAFLNKLIGQNIMAVVDVRNNPQSMKLGFAKRSFSEYIQKAGMKYIHMPELGIPSAFRKGLGTSISHELLFSKYEAEILPRQTDAKNRLQDLIAAIPRLALVCFEADHHFCHRTTLIETMKRENRVAKPVLHL